MQNENYYTTSDLALACTLSIKHLIDHLDKSNPKRVVFYFKNSDDLATMTEKYWKKKLKVEPQVYFAQIRLVKTMIYEQ